jgi:hypothetical protein
MIVTIKARMQLKQSNDVNQQYKGTIAGLKKIVHEEGLTGLYKGIISWVFGWLTGRCCTEIDSIGTQCRIPLHVQRYLLQCEQTCFGVRSQWPQGFGRNRTGQVSKLSRWTRMT